MTRTFKIIRDEDVSGVSGTGIVCEGVVFSDGHAAIHWVGSKYPTTTPHPAGIESVLAIHGHEGKTRLVWDDDLPAPQFGEEDIELLHDLLGMPYLTSEPNMGGRIRKLRQKVRYAMGLQTVP